MAKRWLKRPMNANWGDYGEDDQLGRMNLVTRSKVLEGIAEVTEGITFSLSLPLDYPGGSKVSPGRTPPRLFALSERGNIDGEQVYCQTMSGRSPGARDIICDDMALISLQYSTQWDGLSHIGSLFDADDDGKDEVVFYNGYRGYRDIHPAPADGNVSGDGLKFEGVRADALGIENLAEHGVQGRGVLIDLFRHFGRERRAVGYDDLMRIMDADMVVVEGGDMVCLRTGYADLLLEMKKNPDPALLRRTCSGLDGRDEKLLNWITDSNLACLIADNYAVELLQRSLISPKSHAFLPLHEHCLFKNGIHLGEMWYLSALADWLREHGRNRFLLTAPPLNLPGAVGAPPNPIATV